MGRDAATVDDMVVHCAYPSRLSWGRMMRELLLVGAGLAVALFVWIGAKIFGKAKKAIKPGPTEKEVKAREEVTKTLIEKAKVSAKTEVKVKELEKIEEMPDSPEKLQAAANAIRDL